MALQKQIVSMPLTGGLDEKAGTKFKQPPALDACDNGKFSKTGTIQKRNGFTQLPSSFVPGAGTITSAEQCASYQNERLLFDGNNGFSRAGNGTYIDKGRITGCVFSDDYVQRTEAITTSPTASALANGYRVESWAEIDPEITANNIWHVYSRLVDEGGREVVKKTRITPGIGLSVPRAHAQNDDTNYLNPMVQCVDIGGYLYTLFCDCNPIAANLNFSGVTDIGGGVVEVQMTSANYCGFLVNDVVQITGTVNYNGPHTIIRTNKTANTFRINAAFVATEAGTVAPEDVFGRSTRAAVFASRIDTNAGIGTFTTFATLQANPDGPAFIEPAFYVNATYPLWNVTRVQNAQLADGAGVFRLSVGPDPGKVSAYYRFDYFEGGTGTFEEFLENDSPGLRGSPTPILPVDHQAYFQAELVSHSATERSLSHIACIAVNIPGGNEYVLVAATFLDSATSTKPEVRVMMYNANLTKVIATTALGVAERVLGSGGWGVPPAGGDIPFVYTGVSTDSAPAGSPDTGQAAKHEIHKLVISAAGVVADQEVLRESSTVTTDIFRYNGKDYFGASYAVTRNGQFYAAGAAGSGFQPVNFNSSINVISDFDGHVIAGAGTGLVGNCISTDWLFNGTQDRTLFWNVARVLSPMDGRYYFGSSKIGGVGRGGNTPVDQNRAVFNPSLATMDFLGKRKLPWAEASGSLFLASGLLWEYGGDSFKENGFLTYPQAKDFTALTTGGALSNGTYTYQFVYEWTSLKGGVQRSYPSEPINVTYNDATVPPSTTQRGLFAVYRPIWSQKRESNGLANPRLVMYRSGEVLSGDTTMYRVGDVEILMESSDEFSLILDQAINEAGAQDNEQIYSTGDVGDVFGNIAPPCSTDIVRHKNRLFLAMADGSVWFSKTMVPTRGVEFSDLQVKPVENYTGTISAIGALRDYLVIITTENAYLMGGEGPNDAGAGTDFSVPTIFSRDSGAAFGCMRVNSPIGFIYNAHGGIYQVSPSMAVQWIGSPVEDSVANFPPVRAAVNDSEGEIYFGNDDPTYGFLVYNYVFSTWAKWQPRGPAFNANIACKGMMVHDKVLHLALPSGNLLEQNDGYDDIGLLGGWTYSMTITTPWLRAEQFLHMGRFYRVLLSGDYVSDHTLNVSVFSDYDESILDAQSKAVTLANARPYIFRKHVKNQKTRSIKISVSDTPQGGNFGSYTLDGIAVEYGKRTGTMVTGTAKTLEG